MFSTFRTTTLAAICSPGWIWRMKRLIPLTGIFAATLVAAGLAGGTARAGVITLDVSATFSVSNPDLGQSCATTGCKLGGDIIINNSPGAANGGFVSADVTATGFSPGVGPFTIDGGVSANLGLTQLVINAAAGDVLTLSFSTPTAGSLVGYAGGPLSSADTGIMGFNRAGLFPTGFWILTSGSLTQSAPSVPEPPSLVLLLTALAGLGVVLRTRRA